MKRHFKFLVLLTTLVCLVIGGSITAFASIDVHNDVKFDTKNHVAEFTYDNGLFSSGNSIFKNEMSSDVFGNMLLGEYKYWNFNTSLETKDSKTKVGIIRKNPDGTFVPVTAKKVKNKEYSYDDDGNKIDLGEVEMNSYNWSKSYGTLDEAVEKAYIGNTLILNFSGFDFSFSGTAKEFAEKSVIYIIDSNKKSISETSMYDFLKSLQSETSSDLAKLSAKVTNKDNTSYTLETFFDNKSAVSSKKSNEYIQKIFMGYADNIESANIDLVYDNDEIKSPKINFTASNSGKLRVSIITNRRHLVGFLDLASGFIDDDFTDEPNVKYDIVYPNLTVSNMPTEPQHTFFTVQLNTDIPCVLTDVATGDIIGYTSNGAVDYSVDWGNGTYTINCFPLKDEEKVDENGHGIYYEGRDNSFEVTCFADDFKRPDDGDDDKTYDSDPKAVDEDPEDEENGGEVSVDDIDVTTLGTDKVTTLAQTGMSPNKLILVIAGVFLVLGIILSRKNFKKFISSILVLALFIGSFSAVNIVDVKAENTGTGGFSAGGNGAQYASPGDFCFHVDSPGDVVYKIYAVDVKEYQDKLFTNEGGWNNKTISNDLQWMYNLNGIRLIADSGLETTYTDFYTLADNSTGKDVVCLAKDREDNNKKRGVTFFNNVIADVCNPNRANILSISDANERAQAQAQVQAIRDEISKLGDVNNIISDNAFTLKNNDTSKVAGVLSILSASKYYKTPERIKGLYQKFLGDINVAKISDWSTVQLVAEVGVAAHVSKNYYVISSTTMERTDDAEIWGDPISVANSNKGLVTNIAKLKDTYWYKGTSDGTQYLRGIASKFVQSTYVRTDGSTTTIDGNIGQNHRGVIFFFTTKRGITKKRYDYSVLARANISDGVSTLDSQQTLKHDTRLMRRELIVEKTMQNDGTYKEELKEDKTKYQLWNVNNWQDISADDANGFKAVSTLNDGYSLYMKDGTITTKNGYNATSLTTKNTSEGVLKDALDMPSQNYYYKASPINNSDLNKGKTYSLRIDGDYASGITTKALKSGGSAAHRKKSETMSLFNNGVFPYEDNSPTKNGYKETSIAKKYNNYLDKFNLVNGKAYTVHEVDVDSPDDFSAGCVIPVLEFIETKEPTVTTNCYKINVGYADDRKDSIVYKGTLKFNNMTKTYKISDTAGYLSPTATQYVVAVPSGTKLNIPSGSTKFDTLQSLGNSLTSSSEALSTIAVPNESVTVGATISENKWVGYDIYFIVTDEGEGSNGTNEKVEKNVQLDEYRINKVYNQLAKSNLIRTSYYSQRELGTKLYNVVSDNNKNLTKYNAMLFDKVIDSSSPIISNGLLKTKWVGNLGSANSLKRIKDGDSNLSYVYTKDRASYTGVTSFGLRYNSYTSEYVKIPVLRSLSLELTRAISNDTVVLSSLAIGNASSVINKIMESASKYGVTKDLKANGFNVKGTYSYNPSGASAKNDSAERIIGTHTASTAYKGTYKNNNNDGYSPKYDGRRYKWGTDNYVESVTDNKSNTGLKAESSYANNLINVGPLRFKSATLKIKSKTFKYSPHKRDAGKVTEKILLPYQTLNKNNNPVTVFAESNQVGLNLYFFPEVNMSITMYSNGKYKTITDIPTIGQARRTVDRGLLFGRTDSYAQKKAVGKSSADMSATDGAVYRGSDITLVVTDTGFKRTYFGYVLDIIDQNDKDYNKLTNLGKTDTSSLAVQWGNKKLSDRDAEIKDKFNNKIKNDSIKPIIKLDLTINGKKYENFDISQSGSSFKAEATKIDKSFPISVKKGAIVKNSGYTDLINSIREDYLCSYNEAESLFNNSGMINAILNSMETVSSADNTSIVRSDGKHWYDEYTRTFVVRRLINDSFSLGTVTSQDKIDMNANTNKTEGSGINNIIKGSNVNATWNLSFYTKENDTEKLILTKPIDGANFKVSYLTTEDLQ